MKSLAPYRQKIDQIDQEIIALLRKRYDVIEEVGYLKSRENIPAILEDRIEEVCAHVENMARQSGLDGDFIRKLYRDIINHSCALEEHIIHAQTSKHA